MTGHRALTIRAALPLAALLALGGCQRDAATSAQERETEVLGSIDRSITLALQQMSASDMGNFEPEGDIRCAFATNPAFDPLVQAWGFAHDPESEVQALMKYGGEVAEAAGTEAGGYDAIVDGSTFDSGGMVVDIARVDTEADGSPAPPDRAMARVSVAGQDEVFMEGYWTCGF